MTQEALPVGPPDRRPTQLAFQIGLRRSLRMAYRIPVCVFLHSKPAKKKPVQRAIANEHDRVTMHGMAPFIGTDRNPDKDESKACLVHAARVSQILEHALGHSCSVQLVRNMADSGELASQRIGARTWIERDSVLAMIDRICSQSTKRKE